MTQQSFDLGALPPFGPAELADLLDVPFSAEQLDAIRAPLEPSLVVAGAGSGKTTVMTARVVWLVATGQVQPEQVLGLTFTTKAAGELSSRVRRAVTRYSDRVSGASHEEVGDPTIATYHAFAGRLLAEHGLRIGVEPGARLLTEAGSVQLAHRVVTRTSRDLSTLGYALTSIVEYVRSLDSELAEHCLEPEALREFDRDMIAEVDAEAKVSAAARDLRSTAVTRIELAHLVDELRAARATRDLVDFSDQMRFGARLAEECADVGVALREQFRVVLLDEYQDTSVAQRRLLTGLFGGGHPVTAVGDPLQAIYGWRGASVANIDGFPEHFARIDGSPAPVRRLAENRRSGARILTAANDLAAPLRALHPQVAPLVSPAGGAGGGAVRVALHATYAQEMAWIGDRVREQVDAGTAAGEIAVLARASSDFPALLRSFTDRGLAVEVVGLDGMLSMPEVAEVVAILDVLHDSTANPALIRLLTGPRWRIGVRDLALLGRRAGVLAGGHRHLEAAGVDEQLDAAVAGVDPADIVSLLDALDDPGELDFDPEAIRRFAALSAEIRSLRRGVGDPLPELVHRIIATTGLDIEMAASPELLLLHRAEGLASFVDLVAGFADAEGEASVGAFLAWLSMAARFDQVPELDRPPSPDAVQLMTVHRSKGLEWPVVVLPSLTAKVFPSGRGISRWTTSAPAVPYPARGDAESLPVLAGLAAKDHKAFVAECKIHDAHEELRLVYVAVTRAKRLVVASGSWWGPTQSRPRGPSAYLESLRDQCLAGAGAVDGWAAPPADDEVNPVLGDVDDVAWPPQPDTDVRDRRVAAAIGVRAHDRLDLDDLRAEHATRGSDDVVAPLHGLGAADLEVVRGWDDDIALILDERRSERAAVRAVSLPTSLSASDLVRLAADPVLFTRRLARPVPSAPAPAARRGTRFHAWVESHFGLRPLLEPDDLPGAADADVDSDDDLESMRRSFLTSAYADRVPAEIEVGFTLVLGGRVVPGRIDAVFESTDTAGAVRYEVVDWKTNRQHDADPLQLAIYRIAYAERRGVPADRVDASFVYVRDGAVVRPEHLLTRAELESLLLTSP